MYIDKILGERQWHGQALLECYLEIYFNFTILKSPKKPDYRPDYLINPRTGELLEYDMFYSDFDLAFEFQGEQHYTNTYQQFKDQVKVDISLEKRKTLIHVNAYQLNHKVLTELISNIFMNKEGKNSKKIIQRLFASAAIYSEALKYLDDKSSEYINNTEKKYPTTSTTEALCIYQKKQNSLLKNYNLIPRLK